MRTNIRRFCFPASAQEAAAILARLKATAVVVAGGTRHTRTLSPAVETVVDISDLPLRHIKADGRWLRLGALCTIAELEKSPLLARWARGVIARTAGLGSNALARGMGTLGGNVVRAHPFNNLPPVFLALDAVAACVDGKREKTMPFADLLKPEVMASLGRRYLLTEIRIPAATRRWAAATDRLALTRSDWESYVHCVVAADVKGRKVRRAAVAVAAILPRAARLPRTEALLAGRPATEATAGQAASAAVSELTALTGASPAKAYAREAAGVLIRRCLLEAFKEVS
ncbi:MAG: FAD binding domain-containing protein [Elusimicrobia bacterium]|nr:FAD binding domain-containing protein [Elusimicrobiota bacterium]